MLSTHTLSQFHYYDKNIQHPKYRQISNQENMNYHSIHIEKTNDIRDQDTTLSAIPSFSSTPKCYQSASQVAEDT